MIPVILIALGLVVLASHGRGESHITPGPRVAALPPSPIVVLGEMARRGARPPRAVIVCAIAEAEALERPDLVQAIMDTFVPHSRKMAPPPPPQQQRPLAYSPPQITTLPPARPSLPMPSAITNEQIHRAIEAQSAAERDTCVARDRSPIEGVPPTTWQEFCTRIAREPAIYQSSRHVGQYRQRKERLAELGIDPSSVIGSPAAQQQALDADMTDAHYHVTTSGLAEQHIGRLIRVHGHDDAVRISLSGVLGVIQAAGLEGAVGWLENSADRKRYPHTTAAFARTNGMF